MTFISRVATVLLLTATSVALAQGQSSTSDNELFVSVFPKETDRLTNRGALEIGETECWAKPGRFGFFKVNVDLLEKEGTNITVSLFGEPSIEIKSNGVSRKPDTAYVVGIWTGEFTNPKNSEITYTVELGITTFAVDEDGNYSAPGRYRLLYEENKDKDISVLPLEAYEQRNQVVVHSVSGRIYVPYLNRRYSVIPIEKDLGACRT